MSRAPQPAPDRRGRTRIGTRLGVLLVVPLLGLLGMTAFQATVAFTQYREASDLRGRAEVAVAAAELVDALQAERTALAQDAPTTDAMRSRIEAGAERLSALAPRTSGEERRLLDRALGRTAAAGSLAATSTGGIVAVDGDSPAIDALLRLYARSLDPGALVDNGPAATADLLASAEEAASRERGVLTALVNVNAGSLSPAQLQRATELAASQILLTSRAALSAPEDDRPAIESMVDSLRAAGDSRRALYEPDVDPAVAERWLEGADRRVHGLRELRDAATEQAVAAVDAVASSSRQVLLVSGAALVGTILISLLLVRGATRSIARPLTELASRAEDVATKRLPEAVEAQQAGEGEVHLPRIRAGGAAEVQEVADAFNDVQDTALRLASEQAVLRRNQADALTNLGRRNQTLLGRQLDYISDLEKRETDPAFLEHLFRLDHLASRMRRNAESLLILAGSETPRRRREPAGMAEIVRAAMSEVEDFERVRLGQLGDATVAGPVVIDLIHLVAELVENALNFSPPDTTVEIDGRRLGQGGYQLAVTDHGVGMSDVELQAANRRMAGEDESDGVPTRYLGQYVIARLAAKTGTMVRLQKTAGGRGVTAVVTVSADAVVGGTDRSEVARPLPFAAVQRDRTADHFAPGAGLVHPQPPEVVDPTADPFEPVPSLAEEAGFDAEPAEAVAFDAGFEAAQFEAAQFEDVPVAPPPIPQDAPAQSWTPEPIYDWAAEPSLSAEQPLSTEPSLGTGSAWGGPAWGEPDWGESAPAAPSVAQELIEGAASDDAGSSRLARRVPGASLARSPLGGDAPEPADAGDRSAEGVRSMLSAFQSGRARGRSDTPDPTTATIEAEDQP